MSSAWVDLVSGNFFRVLGVRQLAGRLLDAEDERTQAPVAVVSARYAERYFDSPANAVGKVVRLNGLPFTIVGVVASQFTGVHFARRFELAVPISITVSGYDDVRRLSVNLIGRVPPSSRGVYEASRVDMVLRECCFASTDAMDSPARAGGGPVVVLSDPPVGETTTLLRAPAQGGPRITVADASYGLVWSVDPRARYGALIGALIGGVVLLLVIACANVSTLLLVRAEARSAEFAVRLSLGATARRVVQQCVAESVVLAGCGSCAGVAVAWLTSAAIARSLPAHASGLADLIPRMPQVPALLFTLLLTCVSTVATSIWPARRASNASIGLALGGARTVSSAARRTDHAFVVAQVAFAIVLVSVAASLVATVRNLTSSEGGYRTRGIVLGEIDQTTCATHQVDVVLRCFAAQENEVRQALFASATEAVSGLAGVQGAAISSNAPLLQDVLLVAPIRIPGATDPIPDPIRYAVVSPGFLTMSGIGLAAGRDIEPTDVPSSEGLAVVSESFARRYFPGRGALGQTIVTQDDSVPRTLRVVGVAGDARFDRFGKTADLGRQSGEIFYRPLAQASRAAAGHTPRRSQSDAELLRLRQRIGELSAVRLMSLTTLDQILYDGTVLERIAAGMAGWFGAGAVLLAGVGVFGVLAHSVERRRRELGVRMALGATRGDAFRLVLRESLRLFVMGCFLAVPLTLSASFGVRALMFGASPADPLAMAATCLVLLLTAVLAALLPAMRAVGVDPMVAMRSE
ncbi:MAG: ABC transporter permease [Gemmatimonadaceae bacterium]